MDFPNSNEGFAQLVDELVAELSALQKSEPMKKSEGSASASASAEESMSKDETPAAEDTKGSEDSSASPSASPSPEASAAPAMADAAPADPSPAPADPSADPAAAGESADAPPTVEELASMYAQLPPEALEMHEQAIAMVKQQGHAEPPPAAPPAASPSPAPAMAPEMAMKFEAQIKELEAKLAKALDESKAQTEKVVSVLDQVVNRPVRKSVTGITYHKYEPATSAATDLKKSVAEMSRQEVIKELGEIAKRSDLSKSQRSMINDFILKPGSVTVEKLLAAKLFDSK